MSSWWQRMFRSRGETLAERAEVEGRFDEAARLFVEAGARGEAFRVLVRAAEAAKELAERRGYLTRAYAVARTDELRAIARRALGAVTLSEAEDRAPRNQAERARLAEAAADLEKGGAFRDAARAYRLLGEREAIERVLMLAGDIEGYEREAGADEAAERHRLRRRNAVESFESRWRSGDRLGALAALDPWLAAHADDAEARLLRDERRAQLVNGGRFEARLGDAQLAVVGAFPATLGREAHVSLRGAGVSREHAVIERDGAALTVRDLGSRNGTRVAGLLLAGAVPLGPGAELTLGTDLTLRAEADGDALALVVDRGMDRGRRVVLVSRAWETPLGRVVFAPDGRAVLEPRGAVLLGEQRVVAPIALARGDRIEREGAALEVVR